jgi:hypothetical protein
VSIASWVLLHPATREDAMHAKVGDKIVVDSTHTDQPQRTGTVLEVIERGDVRHYRIQWSDGHETVFFPSSDTHIAPASSR